MNKKLKNILKVVIPLIVIILIIGVILFTNSDNISDKLNIKIDKNVVGNYTGYQLILEASYGGSGVAGQDLGSGTIKKVYNISDNDTFFEPFNGGIWELNLEENKDMLSFFSATEILKINKIEEDVIHLEFEGKEYIAKYDEKINVSSNIRICDGINYSYTIKFSKEK